MFKILALDNLSDEGLKVFADTEGFEVDVKPPQSPEELAKIIGEYDGLIIRSATKVTAEALAKPGKLRVIGRAGVGTDNVDKDAATKHGIVVMNVPGGNTVSTCEHAFALLFALCRNIPDAHRSMAEGKWDRKKFMGSEVAGKTLGIVGVGRIGGAVAKRAQAFEMKVLAFDPILSKMKAEALGVELVTLDELIERSDFISIHAPKNDKTINMLRAEHFKRMKPNCRIINCARGGIVNEQDLAEALREKTIAGAALDVYSAEPFVENPFMALDNIIMTPHLAASTGEAQLTVAVDVAKQIVDYLSTGAIVNAVNVPSMDSAMHAQLAPLLNLGRRLGRFLSLYMGGRPVKLEVSYAGEMGVTDTYPVTASILTGFLEPLVETVNSVSAPVLLKDYGIEFSETRSARAVDYAFEITVTVTTETETHSITGTLFGSQDPRICILDGSRLEAVPDGWMLVCMNEDKPLVIGRVATVIGEAGVNIANFVLGRDARGGQASMVINLDQPLDEDALKKVRELPHITMARLVEI